VKPKTPLADGFRVARPVLESECLVPPAAEDPPVRGVFTMSLKLHVGVVPTTDMDTPTWENSTAHPTRNTHR